MLAAFGPQMQKYLWWKKYLTTLQMIQFVAIFVHSLQLFFYNPCGYPLIYCYFLIGHATMFFFLFKGLIFIHLFYLIFLITYSFEAFYVKSYVVPSKKSDDETKKVHVLDGMCFMSINQKEQHQNETSNNENADCRPRKFGRGQKLLSKAKILT
jgi:hypothetical protein